MPEEQTEQYVEPEQEPEQEPESVEPSEVVQVVTVDDVAYISGDAASAAVDGALGLDDEYQQQVLDGISTLDERLSIVEQSRSAGDVTVIQLTDVQYQLIDDGIRTLCTSVFVLLAMVSALVGIMAFRVFSGGWRR